MNRWSYFQYSSVKADLENSIDKLNVYINETKVVLPHT